MRLPLEEHLRTASQKSVSIEATFDLDMAGSKIKSALSWYKSRDPHFTRYSGELRVMGTVTVESNADSMTKFPPHKESFWADVAVTVGFLTGKLSPKDQAAAWTPKDERNWGTQRQGATVWLLKSNIHPSLLNALSKAVFHHP